MARRQAVERSEALLQPGETTDAWFADADRLGDGGARGEASGYENGWGPNFRVRIGPNYSKFKRKEASKEAMFNLVSADVFRVGARVQPTGPLFNLPKPRCVSPHPDVPSLFIVNMQFPDMPPAVFSKTTDGPCFQVSSSQQRRGMRSV